MPLEADSRWGGAGRLSLDFQEPPREGGEVMDEGNFGRFFSILQKIPSAGERLLQIRKASEDFIFTNSHVMMLLGSIGDGLEREIAVRVRACDGPGQGGSACSSP